MKRIILSIILILCLASPVGAACPGGLCYVDFVGGHESASGANPTTNATTGALQFSPGMSGSTSGVTLAAGDIVVLKGGVTWLWSSVEILWTIPTSGTAGVPITFMGGQQCATFTPIIKCNGTTFPCGSNASATCNGGSAWGTGYPIINGGTDAHVGANQAVRGISSTSKSNLVFDGIKIFNIYNLDESDKGYGFYVDGGSNIEFKNGWIETNGLEGLTFQSGDSNLVNISVHDSHLENNARCTINSSGSLDVVYHIDGFTFYNNDYLGFTKSTAFHSDGLMMQGNNFVAHGYGVRNISIHHNKFYGDWTHGGTAMIFGSGCNTYGGQFRGTAVLSSNTVDHVTVTNGGSGYAAAPDIMFSGGGGTWEVPVAFGTGLYASVSGTPGSFIVYYNAGQ
jgi:hypothetical protein